MTPSTIKLFLPLGDPSELRIAEISNWSGKVIACPRTSLEQLYQRSELDQPGVYILLGENPETGSPMVYIGEAETLRSRLPGHKKREFWTQVLVVFSKDDSLSKSHIKYLEGRLIGIAQDVGKADLDNQQDSGAKLSESDTADMEVFLINYLKLLPVLGTHSFQVSSKPQNQDRASYAGTIKGLKANGAPTSNGFLVYKGSQAVVELRQSEIESGKQGLSKLRERLLQKGIVTQANSGDPWVFQQDYEFSSPSTAGAFVCGGATNGLIFWKSEAGQPLKELI